MRKSLFSSNQNKKDIDVLFSYNGRDQYARPIVLTWDNKDYNLGGVQFWYAEHRAGSLVHHYRISDENDKYTFNLSLETDNLTWSLESAEPVKVPAAMRRKVIEVMT